MGLILLIIVAFARWHKPGGRYSPKKKTSILRADDSPLSVLRQTVFHDYDKFVIPQEVTLIYNAHLCQHPMAPLLPARQQQHPSSSPLGGRSQVDGPRLQRGSHRHSLVEAYLDRLSFGLEP